MKIQIIALDLDGTLLTSQKQITEHSFAVLSRCIEQGIHVVPTTGRTLSGLPRELRELEGLRYAITTNGSLISDLQTGKTVAERKLDWRSALQVFALMQDHAVIYDAYINGKGKGEKRFLDVLGDYGISPLLQGLIRNSREVIPDIAGYIREGQHCPDKINLFFKDDQTRELARELLKQVPEILVTSSMDNNLEINGWGASKGQALLCLADYLGIDREQTMAFGDGENDISMLSMAGLGIAMENGDASAKAAALHVTDSNDMDGVAKGIERFIFHSDRKESEAWKING